MRSKQITWKSSAALAISTLTTLVGSSSCASLLSSFRNASVVTTSVATIQPLRSVQGNSTWVYAIAISPDGRFLASGSYDKKIKIWDLPSNTLLYTLEGHGDAVVSLAISPDSKLLASGSWDNRIKLWNLETGQLLRTLDGHTDDVEAVAVSPNGKWLASGSADTTIR
ncbi:WD40 repeat domain-containing protein [Nostoc sp.]|uniref:WD40 repeat domain-containing protein n=1 Tax=Nostoc sp. TaxID=1180 RepID=UPI002FF9E0AA